MLTPAIIQEIQDADAAQGSSGGHHAFDAKVFLTTGDSFRGHVTLHKDGQTVILHPRLNAAMGNRPADTDARISEHTDAGTGDRPYLIDGSCVAYVQAVDADGELYA